MKFTLLFACLGFWHSGWNLFSFPLLAIAWLVDGGLYRLRQLVKEPFIQAIILLCTLLLLGLLWGTPLEEGRLKWLKYYLLLVFIPLYSLLNKERLPWTIGGLLTGYLGVLVMGIYYWDFTGDQGISLWGMSYLSFSAMLGVGVVVTFGIACLSKSIELKIGLWITGFALLLVQFHQNSRNFLIATLISVLILVFLRYKQEFKKFIGILLVMFSIITIFAYSSPAFQERWAKISSDIDLLQQGNYSSSVGYRLAMWDIGLHGIAERPLLGHGTGTPERYFESTILTYKNGIYKDLPQFQKTSHYHNDWIEIGMHIGIPGMLSLSFLLWSWYQILKANQLGILGAGLISYILLAGLAETFIIFSRTQVLILIITAVAITWQRKIR